MPFNPFFPRAFILASIHEHAPAASGVYGITNAGQWLYIGETDNIRERLIAHLQESDTSLMRSRPTGFVFEMCDRATRPGRQDRLVLEYEPICNRHWSRHRFHRDG